MAKNEQTKITMTYVQVITEFHPAITGLGSLSVKDISSLMSISKAKKVADDLVKEYNELRTKIAQQDCIKDTKTKEPKIVDNLYQYKTEAIQIETNKRLRELDSKEVTIEVSPIKIRT